MSLSLMAMEVQCRSGDRSIISGGPTGERGMGLSYGAGDVSKNELGPVALGNSFRAASSDARLRSDYDPEGLSKFNEE